MSTFDIDMVEAREDGSLIEVKVKDRRMAQFVADLIAPLPIDHQALISMSDEEGGAVLVGTLRTRKDIMVYDAQYVSDDGVLRLYLTEKEYLFPDGSQPVKSGDVIAAIGEALKEYTDLLTDAGMLHRHQDKKPS